MAYIPAVEAGLPGPLPARVSPARRTQPCVLVIEDEDDLRTLIAESLEAGGFAVAQAPTAAEAHERLKGFAYDQIVPAPEAESSLNDAVSFQLSATATTMS